MPWWDKHKDVLDAIRDAVAAEREACAREAEFVIQAKSLAWGEEAVDAGEMIAERIRHRAMESDAR